MSRRVGVVVLNWNGGDQTIACLDSIQTHADAEHFVVVVDNNSRPAERRRLREHYRDRADVRLCLLDENRGYAGGNNAGITAALAGGAELVLVLTQDARLHASALNAMLAAAASDARIGIVGPQILDARVPGRVLSLGERLHVALLCIPRTLLRYRRARFPWYDVTGVMGCAMLLTRQCLETVGSFDESFFAYYEEVDLCLRARQRGFRIVCAPQAVVEHDGMRGFLGGFTPLSAELKARNLLRLMRRWARPADWIVLLPSAALLFAGSFLLYALRGRRDILRALLRGLRAGLGGHGGPLGAAAGAS